MNRKERRAAAHQQRKIDRKAGFPSEPPQSPTPNEPATEKESAKPPISEAKLNSNRANAQHSCGARTEAGHAASSQNHTIHGLARHNGPFRLLPSEDPTDFEALKTGLVDEYEPATTTESILVIGMAESHWLANRAQRLADLCCETETGLVEHPEPFKLYLRYETTHRRAFHKSLNDLLKLRAAQRKAEVGFEAQKRKDEAQSLKNVEEELEKEAPDFADLSKNTELRDDISRLGMASLKKGPEYEALKEQFTAKWGPKKEASQSAAA
jgi:hypothetical protein